MTRGQTSSKILSDPDYFIVSSRFFLEKSSPDKIQMWVWTKFIFQNCTDFFWTRIKSGYDLDISASKNEFCPDWIQTQIWILSGPDFFQKKSGRHLPTSGNNKISSKSNTYTFSSFSKLSRHLFGRYIHNHWFSLLFHFFSYEHIMLWREIPSEKFNGIIIRNNFWKVFIVFIAIFKGSLHLCRSKPF